MKKILQSFKDKRFRYGSFSTVMVLLVVGLFILVNLVTTQLNLTYDMTADQMYTLSDTSKRYLAGLEEDVTIYALFVTGQENLMYKQLLEEYASASGRVTVEYRDPVLYPSFVAQYTSGDEAIQNDSVIVESNKRFKVVQYDEMITTEFNYNTWDYALVSIDIEPQITNAINYVTTESTPVIYHVTGSYEQSLSEGLMKQIGMANYTVREVNLVLNEVPEDCDMLFITMPGQDWSDDETERIRQYLENNGRAYFALGFALERFPNVDSILSAYGVALGDYYVVEGDASYYYTNAPMALIPDYLSHDITDSLISKNLASVQYIATGIETLSIRKPNTVIEPLIVTSNRAYGKMDPQSTTINKEAIDVDGPFTLAMAIVDTIYTDDTYETHIVLTSCSQILDESYNISGNFAFIINTINWLFGADDSDSLYIEPKYVSNTVPLMMDASQEKVLIVISCVVLPVLSVGIGLTIWLRRKYS